MGQSNFQTLKREYLNYRSKEQALALFGLKTPDQIQLEEQKRHQQEIKIKQIMVDSGLTRDLVELIMEGQEIMGWRLGIDDELTFTGHDEFEQ